MELLGFYFAVAIVCLMVAYAGLDATMRLFYFLDLKLRHFIICARVYPMRLRMEKELGLPLTPPWKHHWGFRNNE